MATSANVDNRGYPAPTANQGSGRIGAEVPFTSTVNNSGSSSVTNSSSSKSGSSSSSTTDNTTTSTKNMSDDALAALSALIKQLQSGGTVEQKTSRAKRDQITALTEQLLGQVSTGQAFEDAKGLMALNLQQSLEKNMPAIQRSIEGAGTSASSMQGLLAQQLARDSALAASALGADQAKAYATNRNNFANTLEALTRPNNEVTNSLVSALQIAKGAVVNSQTNRTVNTNSSSQESGSSTSTTTQGPSTQTTNYEPVNTGFGSFGGGSSDPYASPGITALPPINYVNPANNSSTGPGGLPTGIVRNGNSYTYAPPAGTGSIVTNPTIGTNPNGMNGSTTSALDSLLNSLDFNRY